MARSPSSQSYRVINSSSRDSPQDRSYLNDSSILQGENVNQIDETLAACYAGLVGALSTSKTANIQSKQSDMILQLYMAEKQEKDIVISQVDMLNARIQQQESQLEQYKLRIRTLEDRISIGDSTFLYHYSGRDTYKFVHMTPKDFGNY